MNRSPRFPVAVLATALLLTAGATWAVSEVVRGRERAAFANAVETTRGRIEGRLQTYLALLRGGVGLFAAGDVSPEAFTAYAARLDLPRTYPGIQGIGFSQRLGPGGPAAVAAALRARGVPAAQIRTDGPDSLRHAIVYLEPRDRRNAAALGFDMYADPTRRAAMDRAWATGEPALSGRVQLVQEIEEGDIQPGFLVYVPVYRGGARPATPADRRAMLEGFVYAPFRAGDLFAGVFGGEARPRAAFRIYDGSRPAPGALLYDSRTGGVEPAPRPARTATVGMTFAGHTWTLAFASTPSFEAGGSRLLVPLVGLVGLALSLLLYGLARGQVRALHAQTARAEAEAGAARLRLEAADLARSNRELRDFAYVASHDLQEPLRKIRTFAGLLRTEHGAGMPPEAHHYLDRLDQAAARTSDLIRDLLAYARVTTRAVPFERVSLGATLAAVRGDLAGLLDRTGGRVEAAGPLPTVEADPGQLHQLLSHLIGNGLKFHREGVAPVVTVAARETPGTVVLTVTDNGIGFDDRYAARIFGPFERLHGRDAYDGTGIGLAIVRRIAERHGGTVEGRGVPGVGATFTVRLPSRGVPTEGDGPASSPADVAVGEA